MALKKTPLAEMISHTRNKVKYKQLHKHLRALNDLASLNRHRHWAAHEQARAAATLRLRFYRPQASHRARRRIALDWLVRVQLHKAGTPSLHRL